ncbi:hypothetical protein [Streptomyces sp. NPDC058701]|uniref:hypothetical protein n=1 Tax=Streptomyces sp. NPDC058701 TaxID=3346608 RepID=UPI00364902A5
MARPLGALRGRTEQANELAVWLRKVTLGKAVRMLQEHFAYSTTSWSEFRSGSRLPSEELLKAVVERYYVAEPAMRDRQEAEGLRLLAAAKKAEAALGDASAPGQAPVPVPVVRGTDEVTKALLRLDDARMRQIEALEKLAASERRRAQLEDMVSVLQERCTVLEVERDRAREDVRAELESELQVSREYRRQADEKLEHARRAEEKAYQLRLAAEQQVARERLAVNRIDEETTHGAPELSAAGLDDLGLPPLEQIRDVLQAAQEQLEAQDDELDDLEDLIGLDPAPQDPGLVVPEQADDTGPEEERRRAVFTDIGGDQWKADFGVVPEQPEEAQVPDPALAPEQPEEAATSGSRVLPEQPQDNPKYLMIEQPPRIVRYVPIQASPGEKTLARVHQLTEYATTPEDLGTALQELRHRAGGMTQWPSRRLRELFDDEKDPRWATLGVHHWLGGVEVPADWKHLQRIVDSLGATAPEIAAFHSAHKRIVSAYPPSLRAPDPEGGHQASTRAAPDGDALLVKAAYGLGAAAAQFTGMLLPLTQLVGGLTFFALFTGSGTAYGAGIAADPGPSGADMALYAVLGVVMDILFLAAASYGARRGTISTDLKIFVQLGITAQVLSVGLASLALGDQPGPRWLAETIGLL